MIENLNNKDMITINLFGKDIKVKVLCTGDNKYDENGQIKNYNFELNAKELELLNWFVDNIKIEDYKNEILDYCNSTYSEWSSTQIGIDDIMDEINISAIVIRVREKKDSYYPEIALLGDCKCDEEHGICIGFKDNKYMRIESQDWIL